MEISLLRRARRGRVWLSWFTLTVAPVAAVSAGELFSLAYNDWVDTQGPQRTFHDGSGTLYAYFQPVDMAGGQFLGAPMALLEGSGAADDSFNLGGYLDAVGTMARQSNGRLLLAGDRGDATILIGVTPDGRLDPGYVTTLYNRGLRFLTVQPDNRILAAAVDLLKANPPPGSRDVSTPSLLRLLADGSPDGTFTTLQLGSSGILFAPPVVDAAGKIYLVGSFAITRGNQTWYNFVRLNADGTVDTAYAGPTSVPGGMWSTQARGVGLQPDGSAVIVGDFAVGSQVPRDQRFGAIRFDPQGNYDPTFTGLRIGADLGIVNGLRPRAMVMNADGSFYAVSDRLWKFQPNGALDPSFTIPVFGLEAFWLSLGSDGRIYVPGVNRLNGAPAGGIVAFSTSGTPHVAFNPGGFGRAVFPTDAAILPDGRVALGGEFNRYGSAATSLVAILNPDGSLAGEQPNLAAIAPQAVLVAGSSVAPGPDGSVYYLALAKHADNQYYSYLGRLTAAGAADATFAHSLTTTDLNDFNRLSTGPDGTVYLSFEGSAQAVVSGLGSPIRRLLPNGARDDGFNLPASLSSRLGRLLRSAATNEIDRVDVGTFRFLGYNSARQSYVQIVGIDGRCQLYRLQPDGAIDEGFVAPNFGTVNPSQGFPSLFDPVLNRNAQPLSGAFFYSSGPLTDAMEMPDGKIYVSGTFTSLDGHATRGLARLWPNGAVDTGFSLAVGPETAADSYRNPAITSMTSDSYGRLYLAGDFSRLEGIDFPGLARLDGRGAVDADFQPDLRVFYGNSVTLALNASSDLLYAFGAVGSREDRLPGSYRYVEVDPAPVFDTSSYTYDLGGGIKYNALGFLYDGFYPFVWLYERGGWIYVVGKNETGFYFYHFARGHWGYAGLSFYPYYVCLSGPQNGEILQLDGN